MKLWDIVVCCMNGNDANFCGVILGFGRVVVTHVILSMVIPSYRVRRVRL